MLGIEDYTMGLLNLKGFYTEKVTETVLAVGLQEKGTINEFKGSTGGHKFQCIITYLIKKKIINILPTRNSEDIYGP